MTIAPVTLLFTDLVNSAELLQQVDDERAQHILRAHYKLLKNAGLPHGALEVRWLGDGLVTVFVSTTDAVRCAIALQQAARRRAAGERLSIRVGLNVAEAWREETDYFGIPVAIARRLCDRAQGGQILCSGLVAGLLAGQPAFSFRDCGALELKGLATPVAASEVLYRPDEPAALLAHPPFVGRAAELAKLTHHLQEARAGRGGLVLLAGEPGIGKTRLTEEFTESASALGALVLAGRCYEGEWAPPYGPFAEALAAYARNAEPEQLRQDLGLGAPPIAGLVAAIRERLPDIPEAVALQPDEERFRLLDAVSQFLIATAARTPLVLIVDDLHWADKGSIAMLRHVARFAARHRLLILAAYRDMEVDCSHALAAALGALPRETRYEHLQLQGLERAEVEQLLATIAEQQVPDALVAAISAETSGNPFFIREVLLHLVEEGKIFRREGQWASNLALEEMRIPEGIKQVIGRRLERLSAGAQRLLTAAAAFTGGFRLAIAGRVAGLDEAATLDAVDEALAAQVLQRGSDPESCDFVHALIRHTLYGALSPPRQVRLHRHIAETMEELYGEHAAEHAAKIAEQYHRSAALPGAERGVTHALVAADRAEAAYARDEAVTYLRMAWTLLPENDTRRARLLARLAVALAWGLNFDEALTAAQDAATGIATTEGKHAAADYLADATWELHRAGAVRAAWALAEQGLRLVDDRRDKTWVQLMAIDIMRREAEDPDSPGIVLDTPERRAVADAATRLSIPQAELRGILAAMPGFPLPTSRREILEAFSDEAHPLLYGGGEYRRALPMLEEDALRRQREGGISSAVMGWGHVARACTALGQLSAAWQAHDRGAALASRLVGPDPARMEVEWIRYDLAIAVDEGWEDFLAGVQRTLQKRPAWYNFQFAAVRAAAARSYARLGKGDEATALVCEILPALERAPAWAQSYTYIACDAAATLWLAERTDYASVVEPAVRNVVAIDFRTPMRDARLGLAQLCALQGRYDEAVEWFAKARIVLDEEGARPLRAIVDHDEALMYARRGAGGDRERATPLLEAALEQFRAIGMTGWIKRAEELLRDSQQPAVRSEEEGEGKDQPTEVGGRQPETTDQRPETNLFRKEGDYWSITFEGGTFRLKDVKGLHYLAHLLRHPGQEFHVLQLVQCCAESRRQGSGSRPSLIRVEGGQGAEGIQRSRTTSNQGLSLDAKAKAAYQRRLHDLRAELDEAERNNDLGGAAKARAEMEFIAGQLAAAVGLGGRDRLVGADAERARLTVTKVIKSALEKIRTNQPELARYLAASIKTGYFCGFTPDPKRPGTWVL
jgi:class 3 adenylate cyclase/tetratricopeptide (TPR) repeat protein